MALFKRSCVPINSNDEVGPYSFSFAPIMYLRILRLPLFLLQIRPFFIHEMQNFFALKIPFGLTPTISYYFFHLSFFFQMAPKNEVVMEDRRRLPGHGQKKWPLLVRSLSDSAKYLTRNSSSTSALAPASSSHQQSPKSAVETKALTLSLSDSRLFSICTSIGSSNNR